MTNEARQYERELADVRRQKERVEEKMMAQYKSPSPPKKSKGIELRRGSNFWCRKVFERVQYHGFDLLRKFRSDIRCTKSTFAKQIKY